MAKSPTTNSVFNLLKRAQEQTEVVLTIDDQPASYTTRWEDIPKVKT